MSRRTLPLDNDTTDRLGRLADLGVEASDADLNAVLRDFAEKTERRARFDADTRAAAAAFDATGRGLDAAEADAWLARLESGEDVDPPPCRT